MSLYRASLATLLLLPAIALHAQDPFIDAVAGGTPSLELQLRFEDVDDGVNDDAQALTLRTRLGWRTGDFHGFDVLAEFADVRIIGGVDEFAPHSPGHAVIADPPVTLINQALLRYRGDGALDGFTAGYGRQRIIYDNARFVGNVGWRQNEQTYDGLRLDYTVGDLAFSAAYLTGIKGVTPAGDQNVSHYIANASTGAVPGGTLTAYAYLLEIDRTGASNDTLGMRYSGDFPLGDAALLVALEFARQEADRFTANYSLIELGARVAGITANVGHEVLGSDGGAFGVQTPLGTRHAFNGWADQFLATPPTGLRDRYVGVSTRLADFTLAARYHDYVSDSGGIDYGTELNLMVSRAFGRHYTAGLKFADYDADAFSADTRKFWAWVALTL